MTMTKKFTGLVARRPPESRVRVYAIYQQLRVEIPLHGVRQEQRLNQHALAKTLHILSKKE